MAGYIGTKAALLSTTTASVGGDSTVGGDLTVDTNTLYVDSANNRVGIGTSSPSKTLDVEGQLRIRNGGATGYALLEYGASATAANNWHVGSEGDGTYRFYNGNFGSGAERMRILSSGGITFNGDTAAANALDDYEEGTWTASLSGANSATISTQSYNKYVKIGNWVYVSGYIDFSASDSSANGIVVTGLPYTSASLANSTGSCFERYGTGAVIVPYMPNNQDHFEFYEAGRSSSETWNQIAYNEVGQLMAHFHIAYRTV